MRKTASGVVPGSSAPERLSTYLVLQLLQPGPLRLHHLLLCCQLLLTTCRQSTRGRINRKQQAGHDRAGTSPRGKQVPL